MNLQTLNPLIYPVHIHTTHILSVSSYFDREILAKYCINCAIKHTWKYLMYHND